MAQVFYGLNRAFWGGLAQLSIDSGLPPVLNPEPESNFWQVPQIPWGVLFICGLAFPCLTLFTFAMIAHCRSIDIIQKQVQNFSIDNSWSQCCACGHVVPDSGEQMICDRTIILRCIAAWFGSTEGFESTVRGKVQTVLVHQLTHRVFSYLGLNWKSFQFLLPRNPILLVVSLIGNLRRPADLFNQEPQTLRLIH